MSALVTTPEAATLLGIALVTSAVFLAVTAEGSQMPDRVGTPVQLGLLFLGLLLAIGGLYSWLSQFA